jgi:hypothetical protein
MLYAEDEGGPGQAPTPSINPPSGSVATAKRSSNIVNKNQIIKVWNKQVHPPLKTFLLLESLKVLSSEMDPAEIRLIR